MKNSFTKKDIGAGYSSHKEDIFKMMFSLKEIETLFCCRYFYLLSLISLYKSVLPDYSINGPQCRQRIKYYQLAGFVKFRKLYFAEMKPLGNFLWTRMILSVKAWVHSYSQPISRSGAYTYIKYIFLKHSMQYDGYQAVKEHHTCIFPSCSILQYCCWILSSISYIMVNTNKHVGPWWSNLMKNNIIRWIILNK